MIHSKDLLIKKQSPIHSQLTQKHLKHVRDYSKLTTETKTTSVTLLWCLYSLFWTYFPPSFRVFVIDSEQVNVSQVTFYAVFYCPQQLPFWIFRKNKNIWNKNTISLKTDLKTSVNLQRFFRRLTFSKSKTIIRNSYNTSSKTKFFVNLRSKKSNYYIQMHALLFTLKNI